MEIIIGQHTLERSLERGTNVDEITLVLEKGTHWVAKNNKLAKFLVFEFKQNRNGKYYEQKRVEVYYLIENNQMITVTVLVFYGKWEEKL